MVPRPPRDDGSADRHHDPMPPSVWGPATPPVKISSTGRERRVDIPTYSDISLTVFETEGRFKWDTDISTSTCTTASLGRGCAAPGGAGASSGVGAAGGWAAAPFAGPSSSHCATSPRTGT